MSKTLKSFLCLLIAVAMIFAIAACGQQNPPAEEKKAESTAETKAADNKKEDSAPAKLKPATFHIYTYNGDDASKDRNNYCIENFLRVKSSYQNLHM